MLKVNKTLTKFDLRCEDEKNRKESDDEYKRMTDNAFGSEGKQIVNVWGNRGVYWI